MGSAVAMWVVDVVGVVVAAVLVVGHDDLRAHLADDLDQQVRGDVDVRAGKTGFISKAGYCLATLLRLPQGGQEVAVVVLGARSNAGRFMESQNLFSWVSAKAATLFSDKATPQPQPQPQQQ